MMTSDMIIFVLLGVLITGCIIGLIRAYKHWRRYQYAAYTAYCNALQAYWQSRRDYAMAGIPWVESEAEQRLSTSVVSTHLEATAAGLSQDLLEATEARIRTTYTSYTRQA